MSSRSNQLRAFSPGDGLSIAILAAVVGAIRVGSAIALGERFGAEATIGLALLIGGVVGIIACLRP